MLRAHEAKLYLSANDREAKTDITDHVHLSRLELFWEFREILEHNNVVRGIAKGICED